MERRVSPGGGPGRTGFIRWFLLIPAEFLGPYTAVGLLPLIKQTEGPGMVKYSTNFLRP